MSKKKSKPAPEKVRVEDLEKIRASGEKIKVGPMEKIRVTRVRNVLTGQVHDYSPEAEAPPES